VSIRPPDLLDSEPQLRVYQIYPLGKVCVLFACPLVLRFACRFKDVLGTARTTQIGGGVTVAKAAQPLWCCSRAAQRRSSSNRVIPHSHRKIGSKPQRVPSRAWRTSEAIEEKAAEGTALMQADHGPRGGGEAVMARRAGRKGGEAKAATGRDELGGATVQPDTANFLHLCGGRDRSNAARVRRPAQDRRR
jgi:hypothetical protein